MVRGGLGREWGAGMEETPDVCALLIKLGAEHRSADGSAARQLLQEADHRLRDRYISAFATAASRGDLRADLDPVHEASALVAHLDGLRLQWFMSDRTISLADSVSRSADATLERLPPSLPLFARDGVAGDAGEAQAGAVGADDGGGFARGDRLTLH